MRKSLTLMLLAAGARAAAGQVTSPASAFRVEETTIADVHAAMRAGTLTCRALVEQYLRRGQRSTRSSS